MNQELVDYALGQLSAADGQRVEARLSNDPDAAHKVELLRAYLAQWNADGAVEAPAGLALATIAHVAEYMSNHPEGEAAPLAVPRTWANDRPSFAGRPRADIIVAACIAFVFLGLLLPTIQKLRQRSQTVACQDNLHELHTALAGYSDTHGGRFPQVGTPGVPTAGDFVAELTRAGHYPAALKPFCPGDPVNTDVGYSYSLGYRGRFGELIGPRLPDPESSSEMMPISADLPAQPTHGGWNVLMAGGSVRFTKTPSLGNADDIFANSDRQHRAGLHRNDVSLGRPFDMP